MSSSEVESAHSWLRLAAAVLLGTIGGVGMWSVVVVLPTVQAEFDAGRGEASLPYTLTMVGFAFGGILMGRIADRRGIITPLLFGTLMLSAGYVLSGLAENLLQFALAQGLLIGCLGSSATFGPLMADISHWFTRNRGIAVSVCASGNYLAGTIWPKVIQHFVETAGWRATHIGIGLFCIVTMPPLLLLLRRPRPETVSAPVVSSPPTASGSPAREPARSALGMSTNRLQLLLMIAGITCCVAMAMPQVHIVAYCGDLGYGVARGAEMLSLMLGFGIVSRLASGFIADRIGGLATLLLGSVLQGTALVFYLLFDGLTSLYVISAMFGLFQGGIVPSYALIVREYFPPGEAGVRVGFVLMSTLFGMALGGWLSGEIFDLTGSYAMAFLNGSIWNLANALLVSVLLVRAGGLRAAMRAKTAHSRA
jgi:MFS family permease